MSEKVNLVQTNQAITSLRDSDFDTASAIGEVIDNSLQAKASTIKIQTEEVELSARGRRPAGTTRITEIAFGDNGHGMDAQTLHRCLQIGFSTRYDDRSGIGRFGVGVTLGAISQCSHIEIYSKTPNSAKWLYTYIDLEEAKSNPYIATPKTASLPKKYQHLAGTEQGTLMVWKKCDRLEVSREELEHWLARTYRKFIGAKIIQNGEITKNPNVRTISVNDKKLEAFDPLYAISNSLFPDGPAATLFDPIILDDVPVPPDAPVSEKTSRVTIQMSLLPEHWRAGGGGESGRSEAAKKLRLSENEGFSVLRAGREVFYDTMPHFEPRPDPDGIDRWWSAEISFTPVLDRLFSVRNVKRGARFVKELREMIQDQMRPTILDARRKVRSVFTAARKKQTYAGVDVTTEHTEAEKIVKDAAPPPGKAGKEKTADEKRREIDEIIKSVVQNEDDLAAWRAKIESQPCTIVDRDDTTWRGDTFLDIHPQGGQNIIEYNRGHDFFIFVYSAIKELEALSTNSTGSAHSDPSVIAHARALKTALDLLFMAYAQARGQFEDDQQQRVGDTLRFLETNWGLFLRRYVSKYDKKS